jgi:hypothetical protein
MGIRRTSDIGSDAQLLILAIDGSYHEPKEIIMKHIYRYRHAVRVLAVLASTLLGLAVSAPAAFAMRVRSGGGLGGPTVQSPTVPTTVATGGMPGWQITVIVAVAVLLAASIAVVVYRVKTAHGNQVVPAT